MVEVTFTPNADDYVAVQRAIFARQLRSPRFFGRMAGLLVFAFVAGMAAVLVLNGDITMEGVAAIATGAAGGLAMVTIIVGGTWLLLPRRARRLFAQQRSLHHEQRITLTSDGFRLGNARADAFYPWDELPGWQMSPEVLLIFSNDLIAYYLPNRVLTDDQRAQAVTILTEAGVPRR